MASDERAEASDLTRLEALKNRPTSFHIFQALRIIEATYKNNPRLGRSRRPMQDAIRLAQEAEMAFPPSTVSDFELPEDEKPGLLTNRFFGLFGPNGPLPLHLTEYARDRIRNHQDPTLIAFANVFHHRMTSLLYRAWASGEPAPSFDRPDDDPFASKVDAICGRMGGAVADRDAMPDLAKRHFAGLLAQGPKNESGLLAIISGFLKVPAKVESFVGTWLHLEPHDRWKLGNSALGLSASLGSRVWSREAKFRLRIGPIGFADYERLLPGGESLERLTAIIRNYLGDAFEWEANLVLKEGEVPDARLGEGARLGYTTWIGTRPPGG
ncbi:MAG: type VI secretion system baseplate subunit TssG, partial [Pseudomonadota bacterium]